MSVAAYQDVAINGIENVVLPIGVVFAIILWMETKTQKLIMDFLLSCKAGIINIWLSQDSANLSIFVLCKTKHSVQAIREILIVSLYAFKERSEVIVRITEIIQLDDFRTVRRKIGFIF